jgi:hypothetical protein
VSRLYLTTEKDEIARRRGLIPKGQVVEAWADLVEPAAVWLGEESKALLDGAGPPLSVRLALPADAVAVYYGPQLRDIESLPREASLRARVVSARGVAAAWITLDRFGQANAFEPGSPADPVFNLRRVGGGKGHLWRLFRTKQEAIAYMVESYGRESEGAAWARALAVESFEDLVQRHALRDRTP